MVMPAERDERLGAATDVQETCALLDMLESIAGHRSMQHLADDLAARCKEALGVETLVLLLHEPERNAMRMLVLGGTPLGEDDCPE